MTPLFLLLNNIVFSGNIDINCQNGQYSCGEANFYCPQQRDCEIKCLSSDSCYNSNFYVSNAAYEAFNLSCASSISDACDSASIQCQDDGSSTQMTYDWTNSVWNCQGYVCCPLRKGTTKCSAGSDCSVC